ncbi:peptidoglycan DD-metalloendopeptidase family protein [Hymenobacter artigasi]|uniref:Murein DD-endopeptidase MepM/ murein hydrolase activator NlpD n=1 Tax=Hymenobacter artigasi TaxID=2719616 RepID=A0ABX1HGJ6_9BACT|nr:peptidoglycan DD-metalloendopeptidase family protein [Hymenobacter artigasi]NKI89315.1 murein DD-endopeptidase MepM/ murein hydrolase activator NlpD [Hymenobacter artigasi]
MTFLKTTFWRPALLLLALLCLLAGLSPAQAQKRKAPRTKAKAGSTTGKSDFFRIKTPRMRYVRPDTTTVIETEEIPDDNSDAAKSIYFNPAKKLSIVSEDTTTLNEGGQEIVEMSEEVLIDSSWVKVAGYYSIWDTHRVNPYRVDGRSYRDSLRLHLTDPNRQRYAKMPLLSTPITSGFAFRGYRWHYGMDLDLETGDSVKTVFDGVVRIQAWDGGGYGNYILVRHYNGLETVYGHLSKALVTVGTFVKAGQLIGYGGSTGRSTGSHLHFEVRYQGNPINPVLMYDFPGYKLRKDNFTITAALFNYYSRALGHHSSGSSSRSGSPSRARQTVTHKVRSGDTLSEVAERYGVRVSTLKKLNPGLKTLQPGKKLRVK